MRTLKTELRNKLTTTLTIPQDTFNKLILQQFMLNTILFLQPSITLSIPTFLINLNLLIALFRLFALIFYLR